MIALTPEQRAIYAASEAFYDSVLARIGEIPGWEILDVVYEESDDTSVVCLAMADIFYVDIVLPPTGAYAYAWAGDRSGKNVFVRGEEFAAAVWSAHAEFMGRLEAEGVIEALSDR